MPNNEWDPRHGVQSVYRALKLLEYVCSSNDHRGVSLSELSDYIGLSKPSVYRLLNTLQAFHLVSKEPQTGLYHPGPGLIELAQKGLERFEIRKIALPYLEELQKKTNETVHLAILDSGEVVYLEKRESTQTIRMYSAVGRRAPAHCTGLGKAIMAFLPRDERRRILEERGLKPYTANTITSIDEFEQECERIRVRGFAFDLGEHEEEIRCVAAPILDHTGYPVAALSVAIPAFRTDAAQLEIIGVEVKRIASAVSSQLGYKSTNN
ncbi:MAG: Transcriptional regulator, IclR family [Acetothermia bacterium 64_32]|nr:MAG: Transcriptional regulator, IclR family [Acetothermia bacterium 64_32]HAF70562.1 IclR family transcriptional regulator [Candidatus Acetothermia bacterium]